MFDLITANQRQGALLCDDRYHLSILSDKFETTDKVMCNKCQRKMPTAMKDTILSAPQVLVIQILRYYDPSLLNVHTMPNDTLHFGNVSYKLKSVAVHKGQRLDTGHYTCSLMKDGKIYSLYIGKNRCTV